MGQLFPLAKIAFHHLLPGVGIDLPERTRAFAQASADVVHDDIGRGAERRDKLDEARGPIVGSHIHREMTMACVFNPPVNGLEVHDESGAYPLQAEAV